MLRELIAPNLVVDGELNISGQAKLNVNALVSYPEFQLVFDAPEEKMEFALDKGNVSFHGIDESGNTIEIPHLYGYYKLAEGKYGFGFPHLNRFSNRSCSLFYAYFYSNSKVCFPYLRHVLPKMELVNILPYNVRLRRINNRMLKLEIFRADGEPINGDILWDVVLIIFQLISIAFGDFFNIICVEGYNSKELHWVSHIDYDLDKLSLTTNPQELIPEEDLCLFLGGIWDKYSSYDNKNQRLWFNLMHYLMIGMSLPYPLPFIATQVGLEELIHNMREKNNHVIPCKAKRKSFVTKVVTWVEEYIAHNPDDFDDSKAFLEKGNVNSRVNQFLQKSAKERIYSFLNSYQCVAPKYSEVENFVKRRNTATHSRYAYEKGDVQTWFYISSIIKLCFLKEFGYTGRYIDYRDVIGQIKTIS